MNNLRKLLMLSALSVTACSPKDPNLMPPLEPHAAVTANVGQMSVDYNPRLDILFVVDNSESMTPKQDKVSANIDRFVDAFAKDSKIDFHIGVVQISDTIRYGGVVQDNYPDGELQPLRNPDVNADRFVRDASGKFVFNPQAFLSTAPSFVTRATSDKSDPDYYKKVLAASIKLGVIKFADGGPEFEMFFPPLMAALAPDMMNGPNKGFLRNGPTDKANLVVVFITDADDSSNVSAPEMARFLSEAGYGPDRLTVISVDIPVSQGACNLSRDPMGKPYKIEQFLNLVNGKELNLCSNFGDALAKIGADIRSQVAHKDIPLAQTPEVGTLQVLMGGNKVDQKYWHFDSALNHVIIDGDLQVPPGASLNDQITLQYVPVDITHVLNGRAHVLGLGAPPATPPAKTVGN